MNVRLTSNALNVEGDDIAEALQIELGLGQAGSRETALALPAVALVAGFGFEEFLAVVCIGGLGAQACGGEDQ